MPESIRSLTTCLSRSAANFFSAPRREMRFPINVSLEIKKTSGGLNSSAQKLSVSGFTADFSTGDINFLVPMIRVGEYYLAGSEQKLMLEIETPQKTLRIKAVAGCYELVGQHDSVAKYLIGARIAEMSVADRETLEHLVKYGEKAAEKSPSLFDAPPKARKASLFSQLFNL